MKNILAENMLRFGTKNLTESQLENIQEIKLNEAAVVSIRRVNTQSQNINPNTNTMVGKKGQAIDLGSIYKFPIILAAPGINQLNNIKRSGTQLNSLTLDKFEILQTPYLQPTANQKYVTVGGPMKPAGSVQSPIQIISPFKQGSTVPAWHDKERQGMSNLYSGYNLKLDTAPNVNLQIGTDPKTNKPVYLPTTLYFVIPVSFKITPELQKLVQEYQAAYKKNPKIARGQVIRLGKVDLASGDFSMSANIELDQQTIIGFDVQDPKS